ncbi:MAG: PIG-L deacetylase family protein, partial [Anaerolineales bacterium]
MSKKRMLVVLAHPDDESFGMGGTLAYYASIGTEVHLVCATKGEEGELPPELSNGNQTIAEIRQAELECAAQTLGLKSVHYLGFRDSGMQGSPSNDDQRSLYSQPIEEVADLIFEKIQEIKPQVVITFDPDGGYRHPDHIKVHTATRKAFFDCVERDSFSGDSKLFIPGSLYYHTISRKIMRGFAKLLKLIGKDPSSFGKNGDIDINSFINVDYPIHVKIKTGKFKILKN